MSRNKQLREDPAVSQTLKTLQRIYRMGAGIPGLSGDLTDALEKYGCLDGPTYALGLMHMYRSSEFSFHRTDFPKEVYDAWHVLSTAGSQPNASEYIVNSGNVTAMKFALATFIKDVEDGKLSTLHSWEATMRLNDLADEMAILQNRAVRDQLWRDLPPQLVDGFLKTASTLADLLTEPAREEKLRTATTLLQASIDAYREPPVPQNAEIIEVSQQQKMKSNAKRFKL